MKVNIKILDEKAKVPEYAKPGDAGLDLTCVSIEKDEEKNIITYGTGLSIEIPEGYVGLLFPRSSVYKTDLNLANSVGVIDSGYRGEIMFKYRVLSSSFKQYELNDRIGQILILPYPKIELSVKDNLSETDRGVDGYGSTGR